MMARIAGIQRPYGFEVKWKSHNRSMCGLSDGEGEEGDTLFPCSKNRLSANSSPGSAKFEKFPFFRQTNNSFM